jgi:hypothetical protein
VVASSSPDGSTATHDWQLKEHFPPNVILMFDNNTLSINRVL